MLPEASMEVTAQAMRNVSDDDRRLFVSFSMHSRLNTIKSAEAARPIYDDLEYVTIMVPGDALSIIHRPVMRGVPGRDDIERFPLQYQAFKNKKDQATAGGTPLAACGFLTEGQIRELEFFNCRTVEHLAHMPDTHANKFMGIQMLKQKAIDYLKVAEGQAPLTQMRAELEGRDQTIAMLQEQMAALQTQLANLSQKKSRKKTEAEEPEAETEEE